MKLTVEEIEQAAELARLDVPEEQKADYQQRLNAFMLEADKLNELDTDHVPRTTHGLTSLNVMREDEVKASLPLERVFQNAPEEEDGQFVVPAVLE